MDKYKVTKALACTYQAISGAGKTFESFPEILDNVIPYIGGEEEKSEKEPLKIWGHIEGDVIVDATAPAITTQCLRVPVSDGHTAAVFVSFENKPSKEERSFRLGKISAVFHRSFSFQALQSSSLTTSQRTIVHRLSSTETFEGGMAVSIGRLREDSQYDYKFVCLSHNTLRGAAGGAVLLAELLAAKGYFD